jgi:hypothetical protein
MRESMTLIEQANIFKKTNHQNLFFEQISSKKNVSVYSSRYLTSNTKQPKYHRSDPFIIPSIERDDHRHQRRTKRPSYRTSLYHSNSRNSTQIDLPLITARGTKPELITIRRREDTIMNLQRHQAPPPSPSDEQMKRIVSEFKRARQFTTPSPTEKDGNVPYRLPALHQSARRRNIDLNHPSKDAKSTLSNYLQRFY